jgi:effector-binding domain-containing protein
VFIKPAGCYAVLYHIGSYETLEKAYETLVRWIWDHHYRITGNLYEEDLLHYMSTSDPNEYVMKISLQVETS